MTKRTRVIHDDVPVRIRCQKCNRFMVKLGTVVKPTAPVTITVDVHCDGCGNNEEIVVTIQGKT